MQRLDQRNHGWPAPVDERPLRGGSLVSAVAIRSPRRSKRRLAVSLLLGMLLVAGGALVARGVLVNSERTTARPELQRILDDLVAGRGHVAPGVTAYVSGARGRWVGSAGLSNVESGRRMPVDARMRLESVGKAWTATLILQLVGEGRMRLDDTVERWLPGLLPYGSRITVRQLLNHTSGLIDNNDIGRAPAAYLALVGDPALRARLSRVERRWAADPALRFPARLWVEFAASLPLQSVPGTEYHYSNIGYQVAGMIAEEVAGMPLERLFERRIIRPLELSGAAYDPQGEISGPHARGYQVSMDGTRVDATAWHGGVGGAGGIVASAEDEGRFLAALMQGRLLRPPELAALKTPASSVGSAYALGFLVARSGCAGVDYEHGGAGPGFKTSVVASGDGTRVAVLLANGNRENDPEYYALVDRAAKRLFCAA
jgi:D-alanyl-D-alanine carboxypeptidase